MSDFIRVARSIAAKEAKIRVSTGFVICHCCGKTLNNSEKYYCQRQIQDPSNREYAVKLCLDCKDSSLIFFDAFNSE
jgi:hypothetical protein